MILQLLAFQILIFLSSPANITAQPLALLQSDSSSSFRNVTNPFPFGIGEDSYCFEYWSEMAVESDVLQSSGEETAVNVIHRPIFDFQRSNEAITEYVGWEIPDFFFSQARETYIIAVIGSNELVFIVIHSTGFVICGSQFLLPEIPASLNLKGCKFFLEGAQNVRVSYLVADGGKYNHSRESLRRICQWEEGLSMILIGWFIGPDVADLSIENFTDYTQFYRLPQADPCLGSASFYGLFMIAAGTLLGALFLVIGRMWLCTTIKKIKDIKLKEKFFKRNGGLLLQQMFNSSDGVTLDRSKLFNSKDIERATNNFDVNRILGQGGQGTVYKGMLEDGRIIAVKKSKVVDEEKLEEFINELVILSQVNHRNVVKLLGCCLETEVPLLVHEFIPNGTLSQYINDQNEEFPLTWEMRLRIAIEVAGALAYLHSAAAIPIYHRDVKSTNILLDEKCRAKVADFGTSKFIAIDQTHLTTKILGTFGYLDPEYHQSSQLTDKSDVYSFGVVLAELLTGKKPIFSTTSQENVSLAAYFIHFMKENRPGDILDDQVMESMGKKSDQIMAFANLASRCLDLNGKKRPTMEEVSMELKGIRALKKKKPALFSKIMKKLSLKEMK